jgi:hypothetical protein
VYESASTEDEDEFIATVATDLSAFIKHANGFADDAGNDSEVGRAISSLVVSVVDAAVDAGTVVPL